VHHFASTVTYSGTPLLVSRGPVRGQCHLLCIRAIILHKLWGGQSCPQPPFRRLFWPSASVRAPRAPAKSRLQPGLAAPQFMQIVYPRQSKWHWPHAPAAARPEPIASPAGRGDPAKCARLGFVNGVSRENSGGGRLKGSNQASRMKDLGSFGVPSTTGSELNRSLGYKTSDGRVQRHPGYRPAHSGVSLWRYNDG
jgi:hypothetical protein